MRISRSRAAARVNETAATVAGSTPFPSSQHTRSSIVADLPVPGPATTRTWSAVSWAATVGVFYRFAHLVGSQWHRPERSGTTMQSVRGKQLG